MSTKKLLFWSWLVVPSLAALAAGDFPDQDTGVDFANGYPLNCQEVFLRSDSGQKSGNVFYWRFNTENSALTTAKTVTDADVTECLEFDVPTDSGSALVRTLKSRLNADVTEPYNSVVTSGAEFDNIYFDAKLKFTAFDSGAPTPGDDDKILIFVAPDSDDSSKKALHVTAGKFLGRTLTVAAADYVIETAADFDFNAWHRLTVKALPEITRNGKVLGFAIYLDGAAAVCREANYPFLAAYDARRLLTTQAGMLANSRRLFPALTQPASDASLTFVGMGFNGPGKLASITCSTSTDDRAFAGDERIFTLSWQPGVKSFTYTVAGAAAVTISDAAELAVGRREIALGSATTVTISGCTYDEASGYAKGEWVASDCTCAGDAFTIESDTFRASGWLTSRRDVITVGASSGIPTFAQAAHIAETQGEELIVLDEDMVISTDSFSDADGTWCDHGCFTVDSGKTLKLDLNGHTLTGGSMGCSTIRVKGTGSLTILDSSTAKTGRVLPYVGENYFTEPVDPASPQKHWAVDCYANVPSASPSLTIESGVFEGDVTNRLYYSGCTLNCAITGASSFISRTAAEFPHDQYAAEALYFVYDTATGHWTSDGEVTDGFIWCGRGETAAWTDGANWRRGVAPGADDSAIFPATAGEWTVDFGEGVETKKFTVAGRIRMLGTNDFTAVELDCSGALFTADAGAATIVYSGKAPAALAYLADDWAGTVRIQGVTAMTSTVALDGWGNANSKVEFNGVRLTVGGTESHTLPYELVLTDDGDTPAWKNDAGHTGNTVSFAKLSGSGTLVTAYNPIPIRQVLQFRDVSAFTGKVQAEGKRILFGEGAVSTAEAASITWADGVLVKAGAVHSCATAAFLGGVVSDGGAVGDTLCTFTAATVGAESAVVTFVSGVPEMAALEAADGAVKIIDWPLDALVLNGRRVNSDAVAAAALDGASVTLSDALGYDAESRSLLFADQSAAVLPDYYDVTLDAATQSLTFTLNAAALPTMAAYEEVPAFEVADGTARVTLVDSRTTLYYALQTRATLADDWSPVAAADWVKGNGGAIQLYADATGDSGFYRIAVVDAIPATEEE